MAKIAVIKTGGKQYVVKEKQTLKVEKLTGEIGDMINLDTLLVAGEDGQEVAVGKPSLGNKVTGVIKEQGKADKVRVIKYKSKTRYRRNRGHRQPYSKLEIAKIE